jgi:UDP-N-acetylmuramoyl-tripeptide--D-alanyl-D-alanine ligase
LIVATGEFARVAESAGAARGGPHSAPPPILSVEDPLEAYEELRGKLAGDEVLLMKASRGVAMERLIPLFEEDFGGSTPTSGEVEN